MPQSVPLVLAIAGAVLMILALIGGNIGGVNVVLPKLSFRERSFCAIVGLIFIGIGLLSDRQASQQAAIVVTATIPPSPTQVAGGNTA